MTDNQDDTDVSEDGTPSNIYPKYLQEEEMRAANEVYHKFPQIRDDDDDTIRLPNNIEILDTLRFADEGVASFHDTYEALLRNSNSDKFGASDGVTVKAQYKFDLTNSTYKVAPSAIDIDAHLFISHSHTDNDFCSRLAQDLRTTLKDESAVWCDMQEGLHGGDIWWDKIIGELNTRDIFILVLSPASMLSRLVRYELNIALDRHMPIIPILYIDCTIYEDIQHIPYISFLTLEAYDVAFKQLLLTLDRLLDKEAHRIRRKRSQATLLPDMIQMIKAAFTKNRWHDVIRKIYYFTQEAPFTVPAEIYRMQAIALSELGYKIFALEALDSALALVSNESFYLILLEDYATILVALGRWIDLVRIVDEALQLVPTNKRWIARRKQMYSQLEYIKVSTIPTQNVDIPKVFTVSAEADQRYKKQLYTQLAGSIREQKMEIWDRERIHTGPEPVQQEVDAHIDSSQIILLLISPDFSASRQCYTDMKRALARRQENKTIVIPIYIRPTDWPDAPFAELSYLPRSGKPVTSWSKTDNVWYDIAVDIRKACDNLRKS